MGRAGQGAVARGEVAGQARRQGSPAAQQEAQEAQLVSGGLTISISEQLEEYLRFRRNPKILLMLKLLKSEDSLAWSKRVKTNLDYTGTSQLDVFQNSVSETLKRNQALKLAKLPVYYLFKQIDIRHEKNTLFLQRSFSSSQDNAKLRLPVPSRPKIGIHNELASIANTHVRDRRNKTTSKRLTLSNKAFLNYFSMNLHRKQTRMKSL